MSSSSAIRSPAYWVGSALFLLSGSTGLIYEVIWFKRFAHVWGSSTLAMASVVGAFLLGLGVGAHLIGRYADRLAKPLRWYGFCEIGVGVLALIIPFELFGLGGIAAPLYPILRDHAILHYLVRFVLTFLVIGPPCVLMGGTLPLLIKQFTPPGSPLRDSTGWLYAINTFGAATGCYLAGFHLLPSIGLQASNYLTAGLNLAIGVAALAVSSWIAPLPTEAIAPPAPPDTGKQPRPVAAGAASKSVLAEALAAPAPPLPSDRRLKLLYLSVLLSGLAALVLQLVWARQLALILGPATYSFTAVLFVILVGIAVGSLMFRVWAARDISLQKTLMVAIFALLIGTALGQLLVIPLTYMMGPAKDFRGAPFINGVICVAAGGAIELIPALAMGFLFPMFVHITRMGARQAGRAVGNVYAWNTAGTILGATLTSALLIPVLGLTGAVAAAMVLYVAALLIVFPYQRATDYLAAGATAALSLPFVFVAALPHDPMITNSGMYLYGYAPPWEVYRLIKPLHHAVGSMCSVFVAEKTTNGSVLLRVDGKMDASSVEDMNMQLGSAYYARFLKPDAKNVFVIGFGSGATAGASVLFPDTRVTCCEIEPEVFKAGRFFHHVNHKPESFTDRFEMIYEDGRNYLQGSREKYDLILAEPSNPWMVGVSNLFTREFIETAREHLNDGGILVQWIQIYSYTKSEYAMVARTVLDVFPHACLVRISSADSVLMASNKPLRVDKETVVAAQALVNGLPEVRADLRRYLGSDDVATLLLTRQLIGEEGLRRMVDAEGSGLINTDMNLRLEFDAPRHMFTFRDPHVQVQAELNQFILSFTDATWTEAAFRRWDCGKEQLPALATLIDLYADFGLPNEARRLAMFAAQIDPQSPLFMAEKLRFDPPQEPAEYSAAAGQLAGVSIEHASRLGVHLNTQLQPERAVMLFEAVVGVNKSSASAWTNLALTAEAARQLEKARDAYRQALSLDPLNPVAVERYNAFKRRYPEPAAGS